MILIAEPTGLWVTVVLVIGTPIVISAGCVAFAVWGVRHDHPVWAGLALLPVPLLVLFSILVLAGSLTWGTG